MGIPFLDMSVVQNIDTMKLHGHARCWLLLYKGS